jgi:hypothetical protein
MEADQIKEKLIAYLSGEGKDTDIFAILTEENIIKLGRSMPHVEDGSFDGR